MWTILYYSVRKNVLKGVKVRTKLTSIGEANDVGREQAVSGMIKTALFPRFSNPANKKRENREIIDMNMIVIIDQRSVEEEEISSLASRT